MRPLLEVSRKHIFMNLCPLFRPLFHDYGFKKSLLKGIIGERRSPFAGSVVEVGALVQRQLMGPERGVVPWVRY